MTKPHYFVSVTFYAIHKVLDLIYMLRFSFNNNIVSTYRKYIDKGR